MNSKVTVEGQALLNEIQAIKAGKATKTWSPEQLLVIHVRKELHKTQSELAVMLGVPVSTIRDWEQGRRKPDSAALTLIKVARKYPRLVTEAAG